MFELEKIKKQLQPLDETACRAAAERQGQLLKPEGSLGLLEDISIQMAGITGKVKNSADKKILFLFGADNGVYEEGIASAPQEFTHMLMSHYAGTAKCGINVICEANQVDLILVDMGIIGTFEGQNIENHKLMNGTHNFAKEPAMSRETALKAIEIGFDYARYAKNNGYDIIGNGEVGMGNTTTAAACVMAALNISDPEIAVGLGAGLTEDAFARKKQVIADALKKHQPDREDVVDILSKVGGLDLAAMTGLYIGAAYYKLPIVIDGVISIAAALLAYRFHPLTKEYMFASHVSKEPAYRLASEEMKLHPMLQLDMRLGEGTGCPIAMRVIDTALAVMREMNTFSDVAADTEYREELQVDNSRGN